MRGSGERCAQFGGAWIRSSHPTSAHSPTDPVELPSRPSRPYARRSQSDRLKNVESALSALASDPDTSAAMTPRGYDAAGVADGQGLYEAVRATGKTQVSARSRRLNQTAAQTTAVEAAARLYRPLAATAEVLFKSRPDELAALGLTGEHGGSLAERLDRMRDFSRTAREASRVEAFTKINVPVKDFEALDAAIATASESATAQDGRAGTAQDTSAAKKKAFADRDGWMGTMHGHARVVLADRPQLLEPLGIAPR